jgi:hypothetical protein
VPVIYESSRKNISRKWYPRASSLMFRAFISHLRVPVDGQLSAIRQMIEIILPLQIKTMLNTSACALTSLTSILSRITLTFTIISVPPWCQQGTRSNWKV